MISIQTARLVTFASTFPQGSCIAPFKHLPQCQPPPEPRSRGSALEGLEGRFDWDRIRDGQAHLMLVRHGGRKLEDRVLDLVRAVEAARRLAELASLKVEFGSVGDEQDELQIARQLFEQGWA